jgi:hypothetical protein
MGATGVVVTASEEKMGVSSITIVSAVANMGLSGAALAASEVD